MPQQDKRRRSAEKSSQGSEKPSKKPKKRKHENSKSTRRPLILRQDGGEMAPRKTMNSQKGRGLVRDDNPTWEKLAKENREKDARIMELMAQLQSKDAPPVEIQSKRPASATLPGPESGPGKKKSRTNEKNDGIISIFKVIMKDEAFQTVKFIVDEADTDFVIELCVQASRSLQDYFDCDPDLKHKNPKEWALKIREIHSGYGSVITQRLNELRSNTQSSIRDVWFEFHTSKDGPAPQPKELLNVVLRRGLAEAEDGSIAPEKLQRNRAIFAWWVDKVLPKVAGNQTFGPNVRHYQPVSKAMTSDNKVGMTACNEAFAMLCVENCNKKWRYIDNCKKKSTDPDKTAAEYQTPYSSSRTGQNKWGGWTDAARERHSQLRDGIQIARNKDRSVAAEELVLKALQEMHGVKTEKKAKKKSKRGRSQAKKYGFWTEDRMNEACQQEFEEENLFLLYGDDGAPKLDQHEGGKEDSDDETTN